MTKSNQKYRNIDEYHALQAADIREKLEKLRQANFSNLFYFI